VYLTPDSGDAGGRFTYSAAYSVSMKVTTLRLPEGMYDDIAAEAEAQDRSFSEYVRMLLRNRQANTTGEANTLAHTPANTSEYEGRLAELEERVAALEAGGESRNHQPATDDGGVVSDDTADAKAEEPDHSRTNPHSQVVEQAVQWARDNQPVRRQEIIDEFVGDVDIKGDSLWKRHIRDALKDDGFEHDREGGIATWEK
jgi:Arc/MetJ-type ribon-helix-helix transcriptional regulator